MHTEKVIDQVESPKRYLHIVLLVMLIFFVISLVTNILNSIIVDVKQSFDLSLATTGLLPFSFFIAYGVMSIPAGFLSERFGNKALLSFSFLLMTLASLGFVLIPTHIVFSFTLFMLGSCMAILQVIINPMLRAAGGEEHFAFNSVAAQLVFGGASFASPYLYQYLVEDHATENWATTLRSLVPVDIPWATLYIVFAAVSFILVLVVALTKYPSYEKEEDEKLTNGGGAGASDDDGIEATTDSNYMKKQYEAVDSNAKEINNVTIPKINLKKTNKKKYIKATFDI